jgi:signal transduction histidine kinase
VKDSGTGLSASQLEEICAEGVQFNANELQAGQGSGLGLFISKGIVEQHGGRLLVESEGLGKGVTFTASLIN